MKKDEADFDEVVSHLKTDAGLTNAEVVATGGGIDCVRIPCGKYVLYFGTAAAMWGADVYALVDGDEVWDEASKKFDVWTTVSSDETDASAVALGITQAVMEFDQKHCANRDRRAAQYETMLRAKLGEIRDAAMELQGAIEFSRCSDVTENDVWKWASEVVKHSEEIMANTRGELSLPEPE